METGRHLPGRTGVYRGNEQGGAGKTGRKRNAKFCAGTLMQPQCSRLLPKTCGETGGPGRREEKSTKFVRHIDATAMPPRGSQTCGEKVEWGRREEKKYENL
ncbi:hypothetical protein EGI32_19155 [Ferruginibacter sp. HRS2-29]|nr:hypothetical protein [Ferruginibacter sp. HRS2-29]